MINRRSAPTVLTLGLVTLCLSGFAACVEATALDAGRVAGTAHRMLEAPPVHSAMQKRVSAALTAALPPGAPIDAAGLGRAADDVLGQPAFVATFASALEAVSHDAFDGKSESIVLDPARVRFALVAALGTVDPALPPLVAPGATPIVTVDTDAIPDVSAWADALVILARVAGVLGTLLVVAGIAMYDRRARAVARVGRWGIGSGLAVVATFWLLPEYLFPLVGGWTEVAGVVMAAGHALVVPGIVLTSAGVVLTVGANQVSRLARDHTLAVVPRAPMRRATADDHSWPAQPRV